MAKLCSEDEQVKTSFELSLISEKLETRNEISWIHYKLILTGVDKNLVYENEGQKGSGDYVFALKPINEIEKMTEGITGFLKDSAQKSFLFEPLEPSFEIVFERSYRGFSVVIWVDSGNVNFDHYSWDGFGLRFFTTEDKINAFLDSLKSENNLLKEKN